MANEKGQHTVAVKPHNTVGWVITAIAVPVIAFVLSFTGIANQPFWDDEANTALFAQNLNETGTLTGWNGHNLVGFRYSAELNEQLINGFFPPAQYMVAAVGMRMGGYTTIGGRWLFALCGILAIIIAMWWSWQLFRNLQIAVLTGLILSLLPSYLLYIRQCRYYSLGVLFSLSLWALLLAKPGGPYRRILLYASLVLISTALVLTHYLNAMAALAIAASYLFLPRYRNREMVTRLTVVASAALVCGIYILLNSSPFDFDVAREDSVEGIRRILTLVGWQFQGLGSFEFVPLWLLLLLALPFIQGQSSVSINWTPTAMLLIGMLITGVIVTALFSPQPVSSSNVADMRYLVPLIPIGAILAAVVIRIVHSLNPLIGASILFLLIGSNLFYGSYFAKQGLGSTLAKYVAEINTDYISGTEALIGAIGQLPEDRIIQVYPSYMVYPPMFYEPGKKYCCQLRTDKKIEENLRAELGAHLFVESAVPDNIFVPDNRDFPKIRSRIERRYGAGSYQIQSRIEHYWRDRTRPELPWRSFSPPSVRNNLKRGWIVLERNDLL